MRAATFSQVPQVTAPSVQFWAELEAVVRREVPNCAALAAVERLSGGASMETYRVTLTGNDGATFTVCLRRGAGGVDRESELSSGLAVEAQAMMAARDAGVPEPEVLYMLRRADGVGVGFLMTWLDGITLGARVVRAPALAEVRPTLARECGRQLARIHQIDLDASGLRSALRVVEPADYVAETWERYREFPTAQPMIDFTARWLTEHVPTPKQLTLVHNDFRNGNLMFDATDGLVAVLDWETVHIGDPMRDLGWLCTNSWRFGRRDLPVGGFGTREDLFVGYSEVTGQPVDAAAVHYWEVFGSFWWAVGCLGMADHYRTGPDSTVERPAIGRRSSECQLDCVHLLIDGPVELLPGAPGGPPRADATLSAGGAGLDNPDPAAAGADVAALAAIATEAAGDMPRLDELLCSVRDFLHGDVMTATEGRLNFMSRVAGNSLDIVLRELALGPTLRQIERGQLSRLLGEPDAAEAAAGTTDAAAVAELRWQLVHALRDGSMPLDHPGLADYLRHSVTHQVAIDQPRYSAYRHAVARYQAEHPPDG